MGPSQTDDFIQIPSVQHSVDQTRGKAVAAADAVDDTEFACRRDGPLPVVPDHGSPLMAVGGFNLPQGGGHHLHVGEVAVDLGDHLEEGSRVQLGLLLDIGTLDAQSHLQVLLIPDEDIHMLATAEPSIHRDDVLRSPERLLAILDEEHWNLAAVARRLGVERHQVTYRVRVMGLVRP